MTALETTAISREEAFEGVLLGTAVGDSLGLPMEGLSRRRQRRMFPLPLRHRLVAGLGMLSDDTEHTAMVARAILKYPQDPKAFQGALARQMRYWLMALPAGVGFATLRAIGKLWLGVSPARSGVWSAGNGPAMRSSVIGVYFAGDPALRRAFVRASTQITHRDPRAEVAAQAVAETAAWMRQRAEDYESLWSPLAELSDDEEWTTLLAEMRAGLESGQAVGEFAIAIGSADGISGYAYRSVPVAIYAALRHADDFRTALGEIIACGGDTDTAGAITGALVGARVGYRAIPIEWLEPIADWPLSIDYLCELAASLATPGDAPIPSFAWFAVPVRNLVFLAVVLAHGFRRLLPPY